MKRELQKVQRVKEEYVMKKSQVEELSKKKEINKLIEEYSKVKE